VAERLARRTGRTPAWLLDQFRDGDVFRAADAVELGLVDAAATSMRR
jgi:ClpP class serine protease